MAVENRIVYTGGTFDVPHIGHVNFLRQCKKIAGNGDVVVALNTDEFVERYKGAKPIFSFEERKKMLELLEYVTRVIPNTNGEDSKPTLLTIAPAFLVVGSDWAKKDYYQQMSFTQDWLDKNAITLVYVPYTEGISTSEIKRRLK